MANRLSKFLVKEQYLDSINCNIRWHQKQLTPRSSASVHVASGLHNHQSDISISVGKWERFLFLMLLLMLLPVYTAYAYFIDYAYVAV